MTGSVLLRFDARQLSLPGLLAEVEREVAALGNVRRRAEAAAWHAMVPEEALGRLGTNPTKGLAADEAARRLAVHGANRLPVPTPKSAREILAGHLLSPPVLVLGGAAALSIVTGALAEAIIVAAVVGVNAAIGYVTESRVERVIAALQNAGAPEAHVIRDGGSRAVAAATLVPGDLIALQPGQDVPADGRLVATDGLAVDESALTGESAPVDKSASALRHAATPLADRATMVFAGTAVAQGAGIAVVTATGRDTELGRIRSLVARAGNPPTPLERQLDHAGRRLVALSLGCCAAALGLGLLRGLPALQMLRTVVSLGVAAVPEGLPAVATTTLALGMQRMMRRRTLVRRLAAVEGLGATTVICADKTGTLTENRMTVNAWHLGGRDIAQRAHDGQTRRRRPADPLFARALAIGVLCNEAELNGGPDPVQGSATEGALLTAALEHGVDYRRLRAQHPLLDVRPRANGDNWMATVHAAAGGARLVAMKGAPEQVLERATHALVDGTPRPLRAEDRRSALAANARIAGHGMRVLGLAYREVPPGHAPGYHDLVWLGLVGLIDPVRSGVREAIAACRRAGIRTVILTGDQARTAAAVCRELDLVADGEMRVLEAGQLQSVDVDALPELARGVHVFARVTPADKHRIVRALQAGGDIVAMTGDGVNDAAALKAADIGVAMGARGTDLARDVADVVLLDDDFDGIVRAVEQGRIIRDNLGRTLGFLLATNFSEILLTLGALALGIARPLSAIQYLWINLLSDLAPALALALEPAAEDVMRRPPANPAEPVLSRRALLGIGRDGTWLAGAALLAHALGQARYGVGPRAATLAFSTLTAGQLVYALRARPGGNATARPHGSRRLALTVGGSLALQALAVMAPPLRRLLGTTPLSVADWGIVAGGVAVPMLAQGATGLFSSRPSSPPSPARTYSRRQPWRPRNGV